MKHLLTLPLAPLLFLAVSACSSTETTPTPTPNPTPPVEQLPERKPQDRSPLTAACDAMDPVRCLLPWPSSTFLAKDAASATGVRIALDPKNFAGRDDVRSINRADGFSRVTPLVTAYEAKLAPVATTGAGTPVRLFLAQADHPRYGEEMPLRIRVDLNEDDYGGPQSFVFAYPLRALEAGADYVAVVLDDLKADGGAAIEAEPAAKIALGLVAPKTHEEAVLVAYHAPTRATLKKAGIDPARVLRVWDFTTRSAEDATRRLKSMRAEVIGAATQKQTSVAIDSVVVPGTGPIAAIVEGRLTGLPSYVDSTDLAAGLTLDPGGLPVASGTRDAPFRVVVPVGVGDYRVVMYGHGTGGTFHDETFDAEIASLGFGKVGIQFDGWTEKEVLDTLVGLGHMFQGTAHSSARLMQAIADGAGIEASLGGVLGATLGAPMLGNQPNPAAGRHPDDSIPVWAGGSLGGSLGLVYASADPAMKHGVLNVPGAGWTHFIPGSVIVGMLGPILKGNFGGPLDLSHAIAMGQSNWDDIDGAVWAADLADKKQVFLIQESIGDPVLTNPGSELLAVTTGAAQVGAVLVPIAGVKSVKEAVGQSGITQYHVSDEGPFDIHGFAAKNTPAGLAARAQITSFVQSVWAGAPLVTVPAGCTGGSCDFTGK